MKLRPIVILAAVIFSAAALWAAFDGTLIAPPTSAASLLPPSALLTIESPDFSAVLSAWTSSPEKRAWLASDNYAVFSRSHLFGLLANAQTQFAQAAGLPPNMQLLSQVAGKRSIFAWYNIGKLQFLYLSQVPSSGFTQSLLWQSRAKFEQRKAGGFPFYLRTNPQTGRTVCFAVANGWVVLATREDLMAETLALIGGVHNPSLADASWYADSVHAAGQPGDLRMVLNLQKIVPLPQFRSYWVQQNITTMKQYRAAISDLFRSANVYREMRVLLPIKAPQALPAGASAASLTALVPPAAGFYQAVAIPTSKNVIQLLRQKLLDPTPAASQNLTDAPVVTTDTANAGSTTDLQTRIDQAPIVNSTAGRWQPIESLCDKSQILGMLQVESSAPGTNGVFTVFPTAIALHTSQTPNISEWKSALTAILAQQLTVGQLGLAWQQQTNYWRTNGLLPLFFAVKDNFVILSNNASLLTDIMQRAIQSPSAAPNVTYTAGFNHSREGASFLHVTSLLDGTNEDASGSPVAGQSPAFFSGNIASLSKMFNAVQSESIVTRNIGNVVTQSVTYSWKQ